jgi:hypothetical protein
MTEREKRDLAWRLADGSNVFNFEKALELVHFKPMEAEKLIRKREEGQKRQEELGQAFEQLRLALRQFR